MCLVTYWEKPKVAKKDIVCYKWLRSIDGSLYSSFRLFKYNKGLNEAQGEVYVNSFQKFFKKPIYRVYGGFLHCYINSMQPIAAASLYNFSGDKSVVYECIIPKGTEYYISCDKTEICAKAIRLIKEI